MREAYLRDDDDLADDDQAPEQEAPPRPELELNDVEHYASLLFTGEEICTILGLDYSQERNRPEFLQQMRRGSLVQVAKQRNIVFQQAEMGSAPAQTLAAKYLLSAAVAAAGNNE